MKHPETALLRDNPYNNRISFILERDFTTVPMESPHLVFQQFDTQVPTSPHTIKDSMGHDLLPIAGSATPQHSVCCLGSQAEQGLSKPLHHGAEQGQSMGPLTVLKHLKASQQQAKCSAVEKSRKLEMPCRNSPPDARVVISFIGLQKTVELQREKCCQSSAHPVLTCSLSTVSEALWEGRTENSTMTP